MLPILRKYSVLLFFLSFAAPVFADDPQGAADDSVAVHEIRRSVTHIRTLLAGNSQSILEKKDALAAAFESLRERMIPQIKHGPTKTNLNESLDTIQGLVEVIVDQSAQATAHGLPVVNEVLDQVADRLVTLIQARVGAMKAALDFYESIRKDQTRFDNLMSSPELASAPGKSEIQSYPAQIKQAQEAVIVYATIFGYEQFIKSLAKLEVDGRGTYRSHLFLIHLLKIIESTTADLLPNIQNHEEVRAVLMKISEHVVTFGKREITNKGAEAETPQYWDDMVRMFQRKLLEINSGLTPLIATLRDRAVDARAGIDNEFREADRKLNAAQTELSNAQAELRETRDSQQVVAAKLAETERVFVQAKKAYDAVRNIAAQKTEAMQKMLDAVFKHYSTGVTTAEVSVEPYDLATEIVDFDAIAQTLQNNLRGQIAELRAKNKADLHLSLGKHRIAQDFNLIVKVHINRLKSSDPNAKILKYSGNATVTFNFSVLGYVIEDPVSIQIDLVYNKQNKAARSRAISEFISMNLMTFARHAISTAKVKFKNFSLHEVIEAYCEGLLNAN